MVTVGVMEMPIDDVVDVVPMRDRFMATAGPVNMIWIVPAALVFWRTSVRVLFGNVEAMLIYVIAMNVMEMSVMKVIDVVAMPNCCVSTARTMLVVMIGVLVTWMI